MLIFLNKSASLVTMSRILKRTCSLEYQTTYVFLFSACNKQKNSLPYAIKFEKSLLEEEILALESLCRQKIRSKKCILKKINLFCPAHFSWFYFLSFEFEGC